MSFYPQTGVFWGSREIENFVKNWAQDGLDPEIYENFVNKWKTFRKYSKFSFSRIFAFFSKFIEVTP